MKRLLLVLLFLVILGIGGYLMFGNRMFGRQQHNYPVLDVGISSKFTGFKQVGISNRDILDKWLNRIDYLKSGVSVMLPKAKATIDVDSVNIIYVSQEQQSYNYLGKNNEVMSSVGFVYDDKSKNLTLKIQSRHAPNQTDSGYLRSLEYLTIDTLYRIKFPQDLNDVNINSRWRTEFNNRDSKSGFLGYKIGLSFAFVKPVLAYYCAGQFKCGSFHTFCGPDEWSCNPGDQCINTNVYSTFTCSQLCVANSGGFNSCGGNNSFACSVSTVICSTGNVSDCSTGGSCSWVCNASAWSGVCVGTCGTGTETNECGGTRPCSLPPCCTEDCSASNQHCSSYSGPN